MYQERREVFMLIQAIKCAAAQADAAMSSEGDEREFSTEDISYIKRSLLDNVGLRNQMGNLEFFLRR